MNVNSLVSRPLRRNIIKAHRFAMPASTIIVTMVSKNIVIGVAVVKMDHPGRFELKAVSGTLLPPAQNMAQLVTNVVTMFVQEARKK